jgi:hypothetical protein
MATALAVVDAPQPTPLRVSRSLPMFAGGNTIGSFGR